MERSDLRLALLSGPRVRLRPIGIGDAPEAWELLHGHRAITDQLLWDGPESKAELLRRYEAWRQPGPHRPGYQLAILERSRGNFCGSISLGFPLDPEEGELGYWLGEPYWERGLASEAVGLLCWLAFEALGCRRLGARVFEANPGSERVLSKNGFQEDPGGGDQVRKGPGLRARRCFSLSRERWEAIPGSLRPELAQVERVLD
jgi:ribosomal-protein-alanine N-acetyltransferase